MNTITNVKKNGVLLMSSGLDSYSIWRLLNQPVALYCLIGHRYQVREVENLHRLKKFMSINHNLVLDLHFTERLKLGDREATDGHVHHRNLALALTAAIEFPEARRIMMGALYGEGGRDKTGRFFRLSTAVISDSEKEPVKVYAPYGRVTKYGLVKKYLDAFPTEDDLHLLKMTRSCSSQVELAPDIAGCGQCSACFRRWVAMSLNDIHEKYWVHPGAYAWEDWAKTSSGRKSLWGYLKKLSIIDWPGVGWNNYLALRAIRKWRNP